MYYYVFNETNLESNLKPTYIDEYQVPIIGKSKLIRNYKHYLTTFSTEIMSEEEIDYYVNYSVVVSKSSLTSTKIIQRGEDRLEYYSNNKQIRNGLFTYDFYLAKSIYFDLDCSINSIFIFPYDLNIQETEEDEKYYGFVSYTQSEEDSSFYILPKSESLNEADMTFKIIQLYLYGENFETIISTNPNECILFANYTNKNANYSYDIYNYRYIQASLQDIETQINFTGELTIYSIKDEQIDKVNMISGSTINGPFIAYINKSKMASFKTTLKGELKKGFLDNCYKYIHQGRKSGILSTKYGVYSKMSLVKEKYNQINIENIDTLQITALNIVYIYGTSGWKGEILDPILPKEDTEFGPHLIRSSFYNTIGPNCTFLIHNFNTFEKYLYLFIETFSFNISDIFICDKYMVMGQVLDPITIGTTNEDGMIHIDYNETLCIHRVEYAWYKCTDSNNNNNSYSIYNLKMNGYYKKYSEDISFNINFGEKDYVQHDSIIHITNNIPESVLTIDFGFIGSGPILKEKEFVNTFLTNSSEFHYLENQYPPFDISESFDGDNYTIYKKHGYKSIDMNNKETFTIHCQKNTLLYIHNKEGYQITAHNYNIEYNGKNYTNETFASINDTTVNKVFIFGLVGGYVIIKKNDQSSTSKLLSETNSKLFFSYVNFQEELISASPCIFICSNPNETVKISNKYKSNRPNESVFNYDKSDQNLLWFTYPFDVELKISKNLPMRHSIYSNGNFEPIYSEEFNVTGKDFLIRIDPDSINYSRSSTIKAYLKNPDDMALMDNYDILNHQVELHAVDGLLNLKHQPTIEDKEGPKESWLEENLGIIVVVVCVVLGVIIIVVVVVVIVVVKKRKKNQVANSSINQNDDNEGNDNENNENEDDK